MTLSESPAESNEPPFKKRKFFEDQSSLLTGDENSPPPKKTTEDVCTVVSQDVENDTKNSLPGFNETEFKAITSANMSSEDMRTLQEVSGGNMERALDQWYEGGWRVGTKKDTNPVAWEVKPSKLADPQDFVTNIPPLPSSPPYRYIGAFGANGWATRSGTSLIRSGDKVSIERQKITPPKSLKANSAAARRVDVIVRFTNEKGQEVGRLPRETANWVSVLIDQGVCHFEGVCVYAPETVRTNDTVFLQLRCFLWINSFDSSRFKVADNRMAGLYQAKETTEEKDLRLRQIALVTLFEETNLLPTRTNAITAKHKRTGILQAAEIAEQYEKTNGKKEKNDENPESSPPSEPEEDGKELEQDQLDALYKKSQAFDFDAPETEPADTFAMDLRRYQKQALYWMIAKEKDQKNENKEVSMHPLWEEYKWPTKDENDQILPAVVGQDSFYVNPYSGELSGHFPEQEQNCLGGILADEMGLGKTIEMMSLIHSHKSDAAMNQSSTASVSATTANQPSRLTTKNSPIKNAPCTTLVVAPMSLLAQWESEAENASRDGTMKTLVYYGTEKAANLQKICCEENSASAPNMVITSYGVLLSDFNQVAEKGGDRGSHVGLFSLNFFRVILDEAHYIKNRQSKTAKACYEITADHRWVLTGTPIVNRLEDLFSLVRFLRVEPWNNFSFWKTFITTPFESKDYMRALDVVQTVLEPLVLRRTKDMKMPNGEALVPLPPKTIDITEIEFSKQEREVYEYVFARAKRNFAASVEAGTVLKSYTSIFAQILRLRQSCCHPVLVRKKDIVADEEEAAEALDAVNGLADDMDLQALIERFTAETDDETDANAFGAHVLEQIRDEAQNECPICFDSPMIQRTVTGCWHSACKTCILSYISHQVEIGAIPKCPHCREPINSRDVFEVVKHDADEDSDAPRIALQRIGSNSSAKIEALLSHLKALRKEHPGTKSVVFSQFTSFLSLISPALTRASIPFLRLDGTMSQKARAAVLAKFASSDKGTVLLLSLRAGGVGLNLTAAKRVYMMDPWWSFAVEAQAIDRVHRMGQTDEVKVVRFIVAASIEQKMLRIQDRKKFIATSLGMMSDEEKKLQRIEDIKELLS